MDFNSPLPSLELTPARTEPLSTRPTGDHGRLPHWLTLPWPPAFFIPGCFCCGTGARAYSCGGMDPISPVFFVTADRTHFATDTTSYVPSANLSSARSESGAVGNAGIAGYIAGGKTSNAVPVTTADKLTFSSETTAATTSAVLSLARYSHGSLSERSNKAYFAGGFSTPVSLIADMLTFATDSTAAQSTANLSVSRGGLRGISEGATKGYFAGGYIGSNNWTARCDKLTFATDAAASQTTANLSNGRDRYHGLSDGMAQGYFAGGQSTAVLSTFDKITFATDVTAALTTTSMYRYAGSSMSNGVIGYALGGGDVGGLSKSGHKVTFSTDVVTALGASADLSAQRMTIAGFSTVAL